MKPKDMLVISGCVLALIAAGISIYFTQFRRPGLHETLHVGIGRVMARETARLIGNHGEIVTLVMDTRKAPELKTQLDEFERTLKQLGSFKITPKEFETEGKSKYATGAGLSGRRFVRSVKNHPEAAAIVSFVGAPSLTDQEFAELASMKRPKCVAEVRSPEKLKPLIDKKIFNVAIVSRFQFPAPGPRKPRTPEEWFDQRFQVVTAENAASLPEAASQ